MLSLLYLYRGRSFVVYWIGSWLLVAAGLGIVARSYSDSTLGSVLTGLALLFTVSAAGLMRLSVESFPQHSVRWDGRRITAMSAAALWFLVAPFAVPLSTVILTGTLATAGLLAWSGVGYLHLARQVRSAGALVMGIGLTLDCQQSSHRDRDVALHGLGHWSALVGSHGDHDAVCRTGHAHPRLRGHDRRVTPRQSSSCRRKRRSAAPGDHRCLDRVSQPPLLR